jgi:formylglycine-generating enzyme required for sulfatase activity
VILIVVALGCSGQTEDTSEPISVDQPDLEGYCSGEEPAGNPEGSITCNSGKCLVPEGSFWMGTTKGGADECPLREVTLDSYYIDETEVTIADWENCVDDGDCEPIPENCMHWYGSLDIYSEEFPAICIVWEDAVNYCQSKGGRLPTEAEWEKAARGTQGAIWPWGGIAPTCDRANFRLTSLYCNNGVRPVGFYEEWRSAYGLWDTVGNVWEWVSDYYDASYYESAPLVNPEGPTSDCKTTVQSDTEQCFYRGMRGGAFNTTEDVTRGSARSFADPKLVDINIGFRCAY